MSTDTTIDPLTRFVEIEEELRSCEERTKALKEERDLLQARLLDEWADRGQQNASVRGMTVYIANEFYCSKRGDVPTQRVCDLLRQNGFGGMVAEGYNAQSLKARIKELAADDQVPEDLKEVLNFDTVPRLRTRRS